MSQRAAIFAAISPGYSGLRHFFLVNALALPVIGGALWQVRAPSLGALLVVPLALLIANYAEWALHRYLLAYASDFGILPTAMRPHGMIQ